MSREDGPSAVTSGRGIDRADAGQLAGLAAYREAAALAVAEAAEAAAGAETEAWRLQQKGGKDLNPREHVPRPRHLDARRLCKDAASLAGVAASATGGATAVAAWRPSSAGRPQATAAVLASLVSVYDVADLPLEAVRLALQVSRRRIVRGVGVVSGWKARVNIA
eukprot:363069-Chlamydomonas_euryale.AAC.1